MVIMDAGNGPHDNIYGSSSSLVAAAAAGHLGTSHRLMSYVSPLLLLTTVAILSTTFAVVIYHLILIKYCKDRRRGRVHGDGDHHETLTTTSTGQQIPANSSFPGRSGGDSDSSGESISTSGSGGGQVVVGTAGPGIDAKSLEAIPILRYSEKAFAFFRIDQTECVVCLGRLERGERVRWLPSCGHAFHVACIDDWLQAHASCPTCRATVVAAPPQPNDHHHQQQLMLLGLTEEERAAGGGGGGDVVDDVNHRMITRSRSGGLMRQIDMQHMNRYMNMHIPRPKIDTSTRRHQQLIIHNLKRSLPPAAAAAADIANSGFIIRRSLSMDHYNFSVVIEPQQRYSTQQDDHDLVHGTTSTGTSSGGERRAIFNDDHVIQLQQQQYYTNNNSSSSSFSSSSASKCDSQVLYISSSSSNT